MLYVGHKSVAPVATAAFDVVVLLVMTCEVVERLEELATTFPFVTIADELWIEVFVEVGCAVLDEEALWDTRTPAM